MIYVKVQEKEGLMFYAIESPVYVLRQKNGVIVRCEEEKKAQGVLSPDGNEIWQLAGRESLTEDFPLAWEIPMMEYEEWYALQTQPEVPDPEDTDPVIPEDTEPESILTRAELTEKVRQLEQELAQAKALLGIPDQSPQP